MPTTPTTVTVPTTQKENIRVGDTVWYDENQDGLQDANEPGVPGVTVTLKDKDGNVIETTVTDGNGKYIFDNLVPGEYEIIFSNWPSGYEPTKSLQGNDRAKDSDGVTVRFVVTEDDLTFDLGLIKTVSSTVKTGTSKTSAIPRTGEMPTSPLVSSFAFIAAAILLIIFLKKQRRESE